MKKKKRRRRLKLIHIILLSIFVYLGLIYNNQRKLKLRLEAKRNDVQAEINLLEKDIEELDYEIENSNSLQFIERIARDELGMVKPREIMYVDKNKKKNPFLKTKGDEK